MPKRRECYDLFSLMDTENLHRFTRKIFWKINESIPYVNRIVESFFIEKLEVLMKMESDSDRYRSHLSSYEEI